MHRVIGIQFVLKVAIPSFIPVRAGPGSTAIHRRRSNLLGIHAPHRKEMVVLVQWASLADVPHRRVHDILSLPAESQPLKEEVDGILGEDVVLSLGARTSLSCSL